MITEIRCRKCRNLLIGNIQTETQLLKAHGILTACPSVTEETLYFLDDEALPDWVSEKVIENEWIRGRLHCPKCKARMGAFDFVSRQKCDCGETFLPPVHIIKSKVDILKK